MSRLVGVSPNKGPPGDLRDMWGYRETVFFRAQGSTSVNRFLSIDET